MTNHKNKLRNNPIIILDTKKRWNLIRILILINTYKYI